MTSEYWRARAPHGRMSGSAWRALERASSRSDRGWVASARLSSPAPMASSRGVDSGRGDHTRLPLTSRDTGHKSFAMASVGRRSGPVTFRRDRFQRWPGLVPRCLWRPSDRSGSWRRTTPSQRRRSHTLDADDTTVGCDLVSAYGLSTGPSQRRDGDRPPHASGRLGWLASDIGHAAHTLGLPRTCRPATAALAYPSRSRCPRRTWTCLETRAAHRTGPGLRRDNPRAPCVPMPGVPKRCRAQPWETRRRSGWSRRVRQQWAGWRSRASAR